MLGAPVAPTQKSPVYRDPCIQYLYVFDAGASTPTLLAALRILESDLGVASAIPTTDTVLLAPRYKELRKLMGLMEELAGAESEFKAHPRLTTFKWAIQHPFSFVRHVRTDPTDLGRENAEKGQSIAAKRDELKEFLDSSVSRAQFLQAISRHTDEKLYRDAYLNRQPFMRVDLQAVNAVLTDGREVGIDVAVLVHHTGVCLLTFYCQFKGDVKHEDLVRWSVSNQLTIREATVPACVHEHQAKLVGTYPDDIFGARSFQDVEWITRGDLDWSIVDVFELFSAQISSLIREGLPRRVLREGMAGWMSYPVVILRSGSPPLDESLLDPGGERRFLHELLLRDDRSIDFKPQFLADLEDCDVSDVDDHSFFVASSHAVLVYKGDWWDELPREEGRLPEGNDWIPRDFSIVAPIEHLLVEKWVLEVAQERLNQGVFEEVPARQIRAGLGLVVDELAGLAPVQYGSLQKQIDQGRTTFGIDRHLRVLDDQLRWIEGALNASEAESRDRVARRFSGLSLILTLVLGLPALAQVVQFLQGWNALDDDSYLHLGAAINVVTDFARQRPVLLTSCLYAIVTIAVLAVMSRGVSRRPGKVRLPEPFTWPGPPLGVIEDGIDEPPRGDIAAS